LFFHVAADFVHMFDEYGNRVGRDHVIKSN
jgi:hypothetical protein